MPLSHSQVKKDTAEVSVPIYGDTLKIQFYPSRMKDSVWIKWSEIQDAKTLEDAKTALVNINEMLAEMIKSWDYFEDDAQTKMYPLEPAALAELDMTFKTKCLFAMIRHMRPEA